MEVWKVFTEIVHVHSLAQYLTHSKHSMKLILVIICLLTQVKKKIEYLLCVRHCGDDGLAIAQEIQMFIQHGILPQKLSPTVLKCHLGIRYSL